MADSDSVQAALLDKIEQALSKAQTPAALLALAEAFAWVARRATPRGRQELIRVPATKVLAQAG